MKQLLLTMPIVGRLIIFVVRFDVILQNIWQQIVTMLRWLFSSKETTNFTYDLDEYNSRYLACLVSQVLGKDIALILGYIEEIAADCELSAHISTAIDSSDYKYMADRRARYGRRVGWYAIARAMKPRVIVETGVDKGLGACVLTAALKRNSAEGHMGTYFGTDINTKAGYLLSGPYAKFGTILYGDSIESLKKLQGSVDLFINDSDHSMEYEANEYLTIESKLTAGAIVLGDNSHCSQQLLEFSLRNGRRFLLFLERPAHHWYQGAGIGISFPK